MYYAIEVVTLGDYADPRHIIRLAQAAEAAGWDGIFVWDHLGFVWGAPSGDPWVILAAVAQATERLKLATFVTPLPRRRPQVLANTPGHAGPAQRGTSDFLRRAGRGTPGVRRLWRARRRQDPGGSA